MTQFQTPTTAALAGSFAGTFLQRAFGGRCLQGLTVAGALLLAGAAQADGVDIECKVPKAEMRPQMDLQRKLTDEGWKVRRVKLDQGCYEVYGFDAKGKRAEVYFDPKTFEKLLEVEQPPE